MQPTLCLILAALIGIVAGHGRLLNPPSRASAWRQGFNIPANYNDNQLYCGGFQHQQSLGGKCGVCGDPFDGDREHEAGGKYATGLITREYAQGAKMLVTVQLTANHKGWMEFRLCPNNNPNVSATLDCLNRYLLTEAGTKITTFVVTSEVKMINLELDLPAGLTCTQCVLQWKYHAGNSWGYDPETREGCLGCGPQEEFYGCSDIAITHDQSSMATVDQSTLSTVGTTSSTGDNSPNTEETAKADTRSPSTKNTSPTTEETAKADTRSPSTKNTSPTTEKNAPVTGGGGQRCQSVGIWKTVPGLTKWCILNCDRGYCPPSHCSCQ